jgi:hypothetical protein
VRLRVEYLWDDEAKNWGFAVPALTREEAEQRAVDAILYALEGVPDRDYDEQVTEVGYLDVEVRPGAPAVRASA